MTGLQAFILLATAALDPFMMVAVGLAALAIVVFFIIFLRIDHKKQSAKPASALRVEARPATATHTAGGQTDNYIIKEITIEESSKFKHWGNLSLAERIATLTPGDKVLYAAVKKQLVADGLQNFTTDICEVYFNRDRLAVRLIIHRGQIYLFLSISPKSLDRKVYNHEDVSDNDGFEMLPTMIIIKDSAQTDLIPGLVQCILD